MDSAAPTELPPHSRCTQLILGAEGSAIGSQSPHSDVFGDCPIGHSAVAAIAELRIPNLFGQVSDDLDAKFSVEEGSDAGDETDVVVTPSRTASRLREALRRVRRRRRVLLHRGVHLMGASAVHLRRRNQVQSQGGSLFAADVQAALAPRREIHVAGEPPPDQGGRGHVDDDASTAAVVEIRGRLVMEEGCKGSLVELMVRDCMEEPYDVLVEAAGGPWGLVAVDLQAADGVQTHTHLRVHARRHLEARMRAHTGSRMYALRPPPACSRTERCQGLAC